MQTRYVELEQLKQIAGEMPYITRGVFLLSMQSGLRVSDAISVKRSDFDEKGNLHFVARKTGKNGMIYISYDWRKEFLHENFRLNHSSNPYLFAGRRPDTHITRQTVFLHVKKACKKLGINPEGIAPHTARKAFAVETFKKEGLGKTMHALQHSNLATTLLYALSDDPIPQTLKAVEKVQNNIKILEKKVEYLYDYLFGDDVYIPISEYRGQKKSKTDK